MRRFIKENIQQTWVILCKMTSILQEYELSNLKENFCGSIDNEKSMNDIEKLNSEIVEEFMEDQKNIFVQDVGFTDSDEEKTDEHEDIDVEAISRMKPPRRPTVFYRGHAGLASALQYAI